MQRIKEYIIRNKEAIFIISVFSFFLFSMLYNLTHSALWGDEWVEYRYSQAAIRNGDMFKNIIYTFQPPLYNFVMHFWLKVSVDIFWFRLFNVFLGFGTGLFLYFTLTKIYNKKVALISLVGLSTCYRWIYCIQECSEYAMMLFFLFGAMYFFVNSYYKDSYLNAIGIIGFCVGAVYSQYGSAFVVVPLLVTYYFKVVLDKEGKIRRKINITVMYIIAAVAFAAPLYFIFAKRQMEANEITSNTVPLSLEIFKDILFELGRIIGFLFNLHDLDNWMMLWSLVSITIIAALIWLIRNKSISKLKRIILVMYICAYVVHYVLVKLHIYAMVHPDVSAGFYERYSYFYIPYLCVSIPIIVIEIYNNASSEGVKKIIYAISGFAVACSFLSYYLILQNWNKALDDQFAEVWYEEKGWEDTTYIIGMAKDGFNYYVKNNPQFSEGYLDNVSYSLDVNNLPKQFWLWRTNWGGEPYQLAMDKAIDMGYTVIIYNDSGYEGQLAYCYYEGEKEYLPETNIEGN